MSNNIYETLRRLVEWNAPPETSALSLFLNISPSHQHEAVDFARDRCDELLEEHVDAPDADAFAELVNTWLDTLPGIVAKARKKDYDGLALFLCADPPLAQQLSLRFSFEDYASVGNHLELANLLTYAEEYEQAVSICLESEKAEVAEIHIGDVVKPRTVKPSKRRDLAGELSVLLHRLLRDDPSIHIILFGEPSIRDGIEEQLSHEVRSHIIDRSSQTISPRDDGFRRLVHRSLQDYERRSEAAGVAQLLRLKEQDQEVAVGLQDTLRAINKGKIKTLYILQSFEQKGYLCDVCDSLGALPAPPACLACGATVSEVQLEEFVIDQAACCGAEIETVFESDALSQIGGIGALIDEPGSSDQL